MFSLPVPEATEDLEGMSDQKPIQLEGVKSIDFDRLLSLFYPSYVYRSKLHTLNQPF